MPDTIDSPAPKITVIVPTYNCAHLLPRALDSVLAQTFQDFEIIISDDGSTDNTKDVVQPYLSDPRIRYHYDENAGVSSTRNRAIRAARGEYTLMLDGDDTLPQISLERHIEVVEQEGTEWARSAFNRIEGGDTRVVECQPPTVNFIEYVMLNGWSGRSIFFRRTALERVGLYDESLRTFEDIDLDMRLLLAGVPFSSIHEALYDYHIQPQSLVKGQGAARRQFAGLECHSRKYQKPAARENPRIRRAYADTMMKIALGYWRERMGVRHVLRAGLEVLWADPFRPFRLVARRLFRKAEAPTPEAGPAPHPD